MQMQEDPNGSSDNPENVDDLKSGPFSLLYEAVKHNIQILINVRNNHKYIARVKAYDRHMNLYVKSYTVVVAMYFVFMYIYIYMYYYSVVIVFVSKRFHFLGCVVL